MCIIKIGGGVIADIFPCNDNRTPDFFDDYGRQYGSSHAEIKTEQFAEGIEKQGVASEVIAQSLFIRAAQIATQNGFDDDFTKMAHSFLATEPCDCSICLKTKNNPDMWPTNWWMK